MKIAGYAGALWDEERKLIILRPNRSDIPIIRKLFLRKADREAKDGQTVYPEYTLDVPAREKTALQVRTVWALVTVIFRSMHGRKPTNEEKYDLYLDVLDMYAEKVPNRFNGSLRPVHLSDSDVYQAGKIITALLQVLVEYCDLNNVMDESEKPIGDELQATVRTIFNRWTMWRGEQARDPLDYDENGNELSEDEWRKKHPVSDASGIGGALQIAHIVSRGADEVNIDSPWNWLSLLYDEHEYQHKYGWERFLERYPHLRSRVLRARSLAK